MAEQRGELPPDFRFLLQRSLLNSNQADLSLNGNGAGRYIDDNMKLIWTLFLTDRIGQRHSFFEISFIVQQICAGGLTPWLRELLRKQLTPCVILHKPFSFSASEGEGLHALFRCSVTIQGDELRHVLPKENKNWENAVLSLFDDFNSALREVLEFKKMLGGHNAFSDLLFILPSIEKHSQNRHNEQWTVLVELLRDAWSLMAEHEPERAKRIACDWWADVFPVFKRLSLFAAKRHGIIPLEISMGWILSDNGNALWDPAMQRELMRFLATIGENGPGDMIRRLEEAILSGPPDLWFEDRQKQPDDERDKAYRVWLRLAKLDAGGALREKAKKLMESLEQKYQFKLKGDDSEEFPVWFGVRRPRHSVVPKEAEQLCLYLKEHPDVKWHEDDWPATCKDNYGFCFDALCRLGDENFWPDQRWDTAITTWVGVDDDGQFNQIAPVLCSMSEEPFQKLALTVSRWLKKVAKKHGNNQQFFGLCDRVLALHIEESSMSNTEFLTAAINNPTGNVADALVISWFNTFSENGVQLKGRYKKYFTDFCNSDHSDYAFAHTILCLNTQTLYQADMAWTRKTLLPLFSWKNMGEKARFAWQGFLYSPRRSPDLEADMKDFLLETVEHYDQLSRYAENYAALMTYIALDPGDIFSRSEIKRVFEAFPEEGRIYVLDTIWRELKSDDELASKYFENRIRPFFTAIWPKDKNFLTQGISRKMAGICIAAGGNFPEVFDLLKDWLQPLEQPDFIIYQMAAASREKPDIEGLCTQFPKDILYFLGRIIGDESQCWERETIVSCLGKIQQDNPGFASSPEFMRLARKFND